MTLPWSEPITYRSLVDFRSPPYEWPLYLGVYVIAIKENGVRKAIYVGQGNIAGNMQKHESKNEQNLCLNEFMQKRNNNIEVYHVQIDSKKKRDDAEYTIWHYYRSAYNLLCNDISPPGEIDDTVNFPFDKIDLNY